MRNRRASITLRTVLMLKCYYSILGDILEYHFLKQHKSFGTSPDIINHCRQAIEQNLRLWMYSLRLKLGDVELGQDEPNVEKDEETEADWIRITSHPLLAIYGRHVHHCMYMLLYGRVDFVEMYKDTEWISSPDFLEAVDHASRCAKVLHAEENTEARFMFSHASCQLLLNFI